MLSKNYYIDPVAKTKITEPPMDLPEGHWARRELLYWETAYDRLRAEYLDAMKAVDAWKTGHENVLLGIHEWENRYKVLSEQFSQAQVWEAEHAKVVSQLENWVRMFSELKEAGNRLESAYKARVAELEQLTALVKHWQGEHAKVVQLVETHAQWLNDLKADRDRHIARETEKQASINRLTKEIAQARGDQEYWKTEHGKVVLLVEEWVRRFEETKRERAEEAQRLRSDIETMGGAIRTWQTEHGKVVAQVQQWVGWFEDMKKERDAFIRWDADKKTKIADLEAEVDKLLTNPFHYLARSIGRLFNKSNG